MINEIWCGSDDRYGGMVFLKNEQNSSSGYYNIKKHVVISTGRARNKEIKNKSGIEGAIQKS
jgi:hypothetical protein